MNDESKEKKELIEELKKLRERLTEMESLETERNNTETALLLTQFTLDHAPDAVYWMDPDGRFLYANEIACCTLGYSREELLSMGVEDIDPNMPDGIPPEITQATKKAGVGRVETKHRTKDGRIFPVEVMVGYIEYEGKEYHCSFVRDITERKQAEETLRESQEKWRLLTDNSPDHIMLLDTDHTIRFINHTVPDLTKEQVIGKSILDFMPSDYHQMALECFERVIQSCKPDRFETMYFTGEGETQYFDARVSPITDKDGNVTRLICTANNINERKRIEGELYRAHLELEVRVQERTSELARVNKELKEEINERTRAEETLRDSEERHRVLFEGSRDAIMIIAPPSWDFTSGNPAAVQMFGALDEQELCIATSLEVLSRVPARWSPFGSIRPRR